MHQDVGLEGSQESELTSMIESPVTSVSAIHLHAC